MTTGPKWQPLSSIRSLDTAERNALKKAGVDSTKTLLDAAKTPAQEKALARKSGLPVSEIREAVNRADLLRVGGLGPATADLFENAGINSAAELARRNATALRTMLEGFAKAHPELAVRLPNPSSLASLIEKARALTKPATTPAPAEVKDVGQARVLAQAELNRYIDEVLFSDHPEGAHFRDAVLGWRPKSEWPKVQKQFHDAVAKWAAETESSEYTGAPGSFWLSGSLSGLYTEVAIDRTGKVLKTYVEID